MKYTAEVIIKKPVARVVELFDDVDNLKKWQPGLQSFETISGVQGQPGAKARLLFKMGKRDIEMIETIEVRDLPREFSGTYEAKGVWNRVKNYFEAVDENTTKYTTENEFRFTGFMKVVGFLFSSSFKKQGYKYMEYFRDFAEAQ